MRLSQERRGIEEKRNEILPIVLSPTLRTLSRTEAKRELGFAEDSIIVLSIARAVKYKNSHGISFADAHVPFLKQHNMATLIVIGPGDSEDWSSAIAQTVLETTSSPDFPVNALAFPALTIKARATPLSIFFLHQVTGAAGIELCVKTPATLAASSNVTNNKSSRFLYFMPQLTVLILRPFMK
jgi:hypothetical protein